MKLKKEYYHAFELITVTLFIGIFIWLLMSSVFRESAVYDEKLHLDAGYTFLIEHDFRAEPFNPPLAREIIALPSLFNLEVNNDPIILYPRFVVVIISIIFSIYFYWFSHKVFGKKIALLSLFLFVLEPEILAHGHYATTDLILAFLFFMSISLYYLWRSSLDLKKICVLSLILGLTFATKISALPFLLFSFLIIFYLQRKDSGNNFLNLLYWKQKVKFMLIVAVLSGLTVWLTYFLTLEPLLGYRFDPNRKAVELAAENSLVNFALNVPVPLGGYMSTVKQVLLYNYAPYFTKTAFLNGQILQNGSVYFFPIAFLLKTPLPLLAIFAISLFKLIRNNKTNLFLLAPIIAIFGSSMVSTLNLGIRYILPAYPFIILLSSQVFNLKFKFRNLFMAIFVAWYVFGVSNVFPHYISFFNELAGGSKNGYRYLVDSNYDWGQGLIALKNYQDSNNIKNLQLAYFGSANPANYGIKYERINSLSINDPKQVSSLKFDIDRVVAISATCWYFCGYYMNQELSKSGPVDVVGGSILIFRKSDRSNL